MPIKTTSTTTVPANVMTNGFFTGLLNISNSSQVFGINFTMRSPGNFTNNSTFERYGNASKFITVIDAGYGQVVVVDLIKVSDEYFYCLGNMTFSQCYRTQVNQSTLSSLIPHLRDNITMSWSINLSVNPSQQRRYKGNQCEFVSASGYFKDGFGTSSACFSKTVGIIYNITFDTPTNYHYYNELYVTSIFKPAYNSIITLPNQTLEQAPLYDNSTVSSNNYFIAILNQSQPFIATQ